MFLCSTYYGFCGSDGAGGGAPGSVRSGICQRWLAPVRAPRHRDFAFWMLGLEIPLEGLASAAQADDRTVTPLITLWVTLVFMFAGTPCHALKHLAF